MSSMAAALVAGGAPDWQIRLGANWQALDKTTSTLLEAAFMSGSTQVAQIPGVLTSASTNQPFNVDKMEVAGLPVRRTAKDAVSTNCEYWDDEAWVDLDPYAQCLIHAALSVGRETTAIYIGSTAYDISLQAGNQMQIKRMTAKARPLRISGMSAIVDDTAHP